MGASGRARRPHGAPMRHGVVVDIVEGRVGSSEMHRGAAAGTRGSRASGRNAVRIEHRYEGHRRYLGDDPIAFTTLAARLAASGAGGEVVVVDASSGDVLIRQRLQPPAGPAQP